MKIVEDPARSEEILVELARRADSLAFWLFHRDIRVLPPPEELKDDVSGVMQSTLFVRLRALKGSEVLFDGWMVMGESSAALGAGEASISEQDTRSFTDYVYLLMEEHGISPEPRILIDGHPCVS